MEANNAQARAKMRVKQQEVQEDIRIADYIKAKELREQDKERERELEKLEKEKEVARLRAQQEKASDRRAQVDALRAKRYQEANDRKWRKQQLDVAKKQGEMRREIAGARECQRREKAQMMTDQALQEREEFQTVLEWQRVQSETVERKKYQQHEVSNNHREDLLNQISEKEREKTLARQRFLEEGREITI